MSKSPRRNQFGEAHPSLERLIARVESSGSGRKYPVTRKKKKKDKK
jgi:hypothetical protein